MKPKKGDRVRINHVKYGEEAVHEGIVKRMAGDEALAHGAVLCHYLDNGFDVYSLVPYAPKNMINEIDLHYWGLDTIESTVYYSVRSYDLQKSKGD
jgi:hypothetical protein